MKKYQKKNIRRLINLIYKDDKYLDIVYFEIVCEMLKVFCKCRDLKITALYHLDISHLRFDYTVEFFTQSDLEKLLLISKGEYKMNFNENMIELENTLEHIKELETKLSETVMSKFITKKECLLERKRIKNKIFGNLTQLSSEVDKLILELEAEIREDE